MEGCARSDRQVEHTPSPASTPLQEEATWRQTASLQSRSSKGSQVSEIHFDSEAFWRQMSPHAPAARWQAENLKQKVRASISATTDGFARQTSPRASVGSRLSNRGELPSQGVFVDAKAMKAKVRESLARKSYNVSDLYKDRGCWQRIARSPFFEQFTLVVIFVNAIWIAVDTDFNHADILLDAEAPFQVMENLFCTFFTFELCSRFFSFRAKRDCFKDVWFMFDSALVLMMVLETWAMSIVILMTQTSFSGGMGNASVLRIARLLRLTRMARMARLLRVMPELMIMIKGMIAAMRSVFFTLLLQVIIMYVFGIAFTQLLKDTDVGARHFGAVPDSMYALLMYGTFLDDIGSLTNRIGRESPVVAFLFLLFVLMAALTVMNMLIGVLCEVVSAVAATEKEQMLVSWVRSKIQVVLEELDTNGDNVISRAEFIQILENGNACRALRDVGVDVVGLVDLTDVIFDAPQAVRGQELSFGDFMDIILELRGSNTATVKDIMDLRKLVNNLGTHTQEYIERLAENLTRTLATDKTDKSRKSQGSHGWEEYQRRRDEEVLAGRTREPTHQSEKTNVSSEAFSENQQLAEKMVAVQSSSKTDDSHHCEDEGCPLPLKLTPDTELLSQIAGDDSADRWQELPQLAPNKHSSDLQNNRLPTNVQVFNPCFQVNERVSSVRAQAYIENVSGGLLQRQGSIGSGHQGMLPTFSRLGEALSIAMYEFQRTEQDLIQNVCTVAGDSAYSSCAADSEHLHLLHGRGLHT